jgi:hypothetical protein
MLVRHSFVHGIMPVINFFSRRGYVQYRPDRYEKRFREFKPLQKIWERGRRGNNRGDYARLYFLISNIEALEESGVPGAVAELGVFKGSSAKIIRQFAPNRELYLFDTFEGFPEEHAKRDPTGTGTGGYASGLDQVRDFVGDDPAIKYCKGMFPETASMVPESTKFALVHLDCDLYTPTKAAMEFFYPRLAPGGLLILHDYHSGCWPGVTQAADEYLADKPEGLIRVPDKSGTAALMKQRDITVSHVSPAAERAGEPA